VITTPWFDYPAWNPLFVALMRFDPESLPREVRQSVISVVLRIGTYFPVNDATQQRLSEFNNQPLICDACQGRSPVSPSRRNDRAPRQQVEQEPPVVLGIQIDCLYRPARPRGPQDCRLVCTISSSSSGTTAPARSMTTQRQVCT
jgi:hypothetical protein